MASKIKASGTKAAASKPVGGKAAVPKGAAVKAASTLNRPQNKAKSASPAATKTSSVKPVGKAGSAKPAVKAPVKAQSASSKAKSLMVTRSSTAPAKPGTPKAPVKAAVKAAVMSMASKPALKTAAPATINPVKATKVEKPTVAAVKVQPPKAQAPPVVPVAPVQTAAAKLAPVVAAPASKAIAPKLVAQHPVPVTAKPAVAAPVAPPVATEPRKPVSARHGFKTGEWIVYPAHGVGKVVAIDEQEIAGMSLELFVISFEKDKLTLRVPTGKAQSVGMRKLAEEAMMTRALEVLKGRARIKRTMWSRRAQEFDQKINSGDLMAIAEVVRDLFRADNQPEQSYSERQLFEQALDRMARELAIVEKLDDRGAVQRIMEVLNKSAKSRRPPEAAPVGAAEEDDEAHAA